MLRTKLNELFKQWRPAFKQQRTCERATQLAVGLLCGMGRRTITRAICFLNLQFQEWSAHYRFFSRSKWEPNDLFEPVIKQAVPRFCHSIIAVAFDDTAVKRTGKKLSVARWLRDPMSPPFRANLIWGVRFLQASLLLPLYRDHENSSARGLPLCFEQSIPVKKPRAKATDEEKKAWKNRQKQSNLSTHFRAMVGGLRVRLDAAGQAAKTLVAVVDGSYCNRTTFGKPLGERKVLLARCRKDIRLCYPAPEGSRGVYGKEKFTPEDVAKDDRIPWRKVRIYHGGRFREVSYKEVKGVLWEGGGKRRLLRLLVVRPVAYRKTKKGRLYYRQRAYLLCDDLTLAAKELLQSYFDRWEIEVNHRDEKEILGVGQAQVWSAKSHPRQPAFAVAAYSLLLLAGLLAYGPARATDYEALPKWRKKARRPSCLDLVTLLRRQTEEHRQQKQDEGGFDSVLGYSTMVKTAAA